MDWLSGENDFAALSVKDLLVARDFFHAHLVHKANVVGTAIGRYRIRKDEAWPDGTGRPVALPGASRTARTLQNSEVRPYSWPAILVFVQRWLGRDEFRAGGGAAATDFVPGAVYLPDGRQVPVCVVAVEKDEMRPPGAANYAYPRNLIGGGYPIITEVQEEERVASVGCLVTDGYLTYALTNRHVCGTPGAPVSSILNGNPEVIGASSAKQLTRRPFEEVYAGWPGRNTYVNFDIGLIEIDDLHRWTTQVYGIGAIGELADISVENLTLRLIGCPVIAHGAASRAMKGEIAALFYRYKSVGGFDYVADFLIGPRAGAGSVGTHPGDSGTLWLIERESGALPMPIALQWGGQVFQEPGRSAGSAYALATCLSTVCNALEVDLLRDWNLDQPDYWGAVGHYGIANEAIGKIANSKLKSLMNANLERMTFLTPDITKKDTSGLSKHDFVPLADVPDLVWKIGPYRRGGMKSPEHANHFADMDRVLAQPVYGGKTLLEICHGKPQNVAVPVWQAYYDAVHAEHPKIEESRGLLPFRVWQIYDAMVEYVKAGDVARFLCAAGVISHYVGDACQPLHISYLFNGDPDHLVTVSVHNSKTDETIDKEVPRGSGVHAAYEDDMVDYNTAAILTGVAARRDAAQALDLVTGGHAAAIATVALMQKTFAAISPAALIDVYVAAQDQKPKQRAEALWASFGDATMTVMTEGCLTLAQLWDSAWAEGGGDATIAALGAIEETTLETIYRDRNFLPSHTLDTIGPLLAGATPPPSPARAAKPARKVKKKAAAKRHR